MARKSAPPRSNTQPMPNGAMPSQPGPGIGIGNTKVSIKTPRTPPPPAPTRLTAKPPKLSVSKPSKARR